MASVRKKVEGAETIKTDIVTGAATTATVTALQKFLTQPDSSGVVLGRTATGNSASRTTSKTTSKTASKSRKIVAAPIQADPTLSSTCSSREKYALVTEVVNVCLSFLTESLKARSQRRLFTAAKDAETTPTSKRTALQPRSGNASPVRTSPVKNEKTARSSPSSSSSSPSSSRSLKKCTPPSVLIATAECARLAFTFLRSARAQDLGGVRDMPALQLERGMLALISKLMALGLDDLAVKELCAVKRRFEAGSKAREGATEKETLATLLLLKVDFEKRPELLPLAITYQSYVLRVISMAGKPRVVEQLVEILDEDFPGSPPALILQSVKITDPSKAAKQLDSLSQLILALCPSVSSSADELASSPTNAPRPSAALKLQVLALRIRQSWWKLAEHQADIVRELLDPMSRCLGAFARRSVGSSPAENYRLVAKAFSTLGPLESTALSRPLLFNIHNILLNLAEKSQMTEQVHFCIAALEENCQDLSLDHSRRLALLVKKFSLNLQVAENEEESKTILQALQSGLAKKVQGSSADYDLLLSSLTNLCKIMTTVDIIDSTGRREISSLAANFALRYSKSLPGKNESHLQTIITFALHCNKSVDESTNWVTAEAVKILIHAGGLQSVSVSASTTPILDAWMSSHISISLSRVLRILLLRAVRLNPKNSVQLTYDDAGLSAVERGALAELQLKYAIELASKRKYHVALQGAVSDLLTVLAEVYPEACFPIRRARVALSVFRLREMYPTLVHTEVFQTWTKNLHINRATLGEDSGLEEYLQDLTAGIAVSRLFTDHLPTITELNEVLPIWQSIIEGCDDMTALSRRVDDPESLITQLKGINAYLSMLGEDHASVRSKRLLIRLIHLQDGEKDEWCHEMVDLARQFLETGYSILTSDILGQILRVVNNDNVNAMSRLKYYVLTAEHRLSLDQYDQCGSLIVEAKALRESIPPQTIPRDQRHEYEMLHARSWLVHSHYMLAIGFPHEALSGAKQAVRLLSSVWSALERSRDDVGKGQRQRLSSPDLKDPSQLEIGGLVKGVSKLQLAPKEDSASVGTPDRNTKGAAFWPLIPLLVKSLMHLSNMYQHHGIYNEANYYSERALHSAQVVGSGPLLSRVRSHRAALLLVAGRLDDAELCLAQDDGNDSSHPSLAMAERLCVKADLRANEGDLEEASALFEKAERVFDHLSSDPSLIGLEDIADSDPSADKNDDSKNKRIVVTKSGKQRPSAKSVKTVTQSVASRSSRAKPAGSRRKECAEQTDHQGQSTPIASGDVLLFSKWRAEVTLRKALIQIRLGESVEFILADLQIASMVQPGSLHRLVRYFDLMSKATSALEMDVTLNVLSESVLSWPAILKSKCLEPQSNAQAIVKPTQRKPIPSNKASVRNSKARAITKVDYEKLLHEARECLIGGFKTSFQLSNTVQTHLESGLLSSASLLLSATSPSLADHLDPVAESLAIDMSRLKALQFEQSVVSIDRSHSTDFEAYSWPIGNGNHYPETVTPADYQENYIDIIPAPWTAVSMCLSDDCSELYIARYRAGEAPFILRLPFARHKPEGVDDEETPFDFHQGKAELRDILELSNQSCHTSSDPEAKSTKSKWWNEREDLDKRLHELLINIENIWFGGFKAILSPQTHHPDDSDKFRKSFDDILDRHLPSRQASRGSSKKLVLDHNVLELFIRLGDDRDGEIDLDDALADLLYFVVDLLQFNGECNAYDEIDFDSMAVEVLDALRDCHAEISSRNNVDDQHLILVLDRRLQAFPWESLPFLENTSVSRVGSMLSLRECILAMRHSLSARTISHEHAFHPVVSNKSGTYILNPFSDLKATQATLAPALGSLMKKGGSWNSIVDQAPTEDEFCAALSNKSVVLYFGHGAGSQYVRPRAIRRLDACSEVVWLMGCSSGTVVEHGDLEPAAVPLAYLLAGGKRSQSTSTEDPDGESVNDSRAGKCLSVVANLWDVTDKDIDRFSLAVGEKWGLWSIPEKQQKFPSKMHGRREIIAAPATPQQGFKAPKTPKVCKTPVAIKTPARSQSRPRKEGGGQQSLVQAVAQSRDACYLRYLNGAAPVVFGIPVYLSE